MSGRDAMLARLRTALGPDPTVPPVPRDYRRAGEPVGDPAGDGDGRAAVVDLFVDRVEDYRATVLRCGPDEVERAVAEGLGDAVRVVVPAGLPDDWLPGRVEVHRDGGPDGHTLSHAELDTMDGVVTAARVGAAQTGTIVLDGEPDQGRRAITLVPDLHVCIVHTDQVVADVPEAVAALDPTRPQTWISGPSATSDIELDRVEGVHGPRTLVVVLVDG